MKIYKKAFSRRIIDFGFLFSLVLLAGCASTVSVNVQRPAELDLHGARKISVVPFRNETSVMPNLYKGRKRKSGTEFFTDLILNAANATLGDPDLQKCSRYIEDNLRSSLVNSGYFEFIDSKLVADSLKKGRDVPCEVYVSGELTDFHVDYEEREAEKIVSNKKVMVKEHKKIVSLRVQYTIVDAKNGSVYADKTQYFERSTGWLEKHERMTSTVEMLKSDFNSLINEIMRKIKPYTVTRQVKLLKNKSKDEAVKSKMALADEFVERNSISKAAEVYVECYELTGNFEAGYNGAMLLMQQNEFERSGQIMQKLYSQTGDKRARTALATIENEILYQKKLDLQKKNREENLNQSEASENSASSYIDAK
ncbi:MAG: hypothetical protein KBT11_03270 [Treponema sp.]|nr:hypothetical protein [Candidatus Treponema equifaecale]